MDKTIFCLVFIIQLIPLTIYIFLFDVWTYVSVFSLWLGAVFFGYSIARTWPHKK